MSAPQPVMPWLGPPAFHFSTSDGVMVGPAFSTTFKVFATMIVGGCAVALVQMGWAGQLSHANQTNVSVASWGLSWFSAGLLLMGVTWWNILRSVT
ncbi:MAG: hypothetical protein H7224_02155, partial [Polaromonas sp.]|nr:hypothetical protein [Polaromonas sp.]